METMAMTRTAVTITTLAQQIGTLHREIKLRGADRYEEMFKLLTQAKKDVGEGGWLRWLKDHEDTLGFGERQARLYMREPVSRDADKAANAERNRAHRARKYDPVKKKLDNARQHAREQKYARIAKKVEEIAAKRQEPVTQVLQALEAGRDLRKEAQAQREHAERVRQAEIKAIESRIPIYMGVTAADVDLARKIVGAGYRTLSLKTHPDKGGTESAQSALSRARDWLLRLVDNPLTKIRRDNT